MINNSGCSSLQLNLLHQWLVLELNLKFTDSFLKSIEEQFFLSLFSEGVILMKT